MSEVRRRWTKERLRELNLILWTVWDPIGAGVPLDEYENYAPRVASVLERGGDVAAVAVVLSEIRDKQMGIESGSDRDREAARKIVQWFRTLEHPGFEAHDDL